MLANYDLCKPDDFRCTIRLNLDLFTIVDRPVTNAAVEILLVSSAINHLPSDAACR